MPGDPGAEGVFRMQPRSQRYRGAEWNLDPSEGFDPAEFADFLEADASALPAASAVEGRLRQQRWGMVRENAGATPPAASRGGGARSRRRFPDPKPNLPR